jgi:hypothetical protein
LANLHMTKYKVVQIWPGLIVCKQVTVCPGQMLTTLYDVITADNNCLAVITNLLLERDFSPQADG